MQSVQVVRLVLEAEAQLGQVATQHLLEQLLQQVEQVQLETLADQVQLVRHHSQHLMADRMEQLLEMQAVQVAQVQSMWSIGYEIIRGH
jgi:hypothetical protein